MVVDSYGREATMCTEQDAAQAAYENWNSRDRQMRGWSSPAVWSENGHLYYDVVAHMSDQSGEGMLQQIVNIGGLYYAVKW